MTADAGTTVCAMLAALVTAGIAGGAGFVGFAIGRRGERRHRERLYVILILVAFAVLAYTVRTGNWLMIGGMVLVIISQVRLYAIARRSPP